MSAEDRPTDPNEDPPQSPEVEGTEGTPEAPPPGTDTPPARGEAKGPVKASAPARPSAERERVDVYTVTLPVFEGPLDLLLHLIQKHELDIKDIPIGFVTEKYLEYIQMMQELSIDIASEYLVMAATLTFIKSKTLLPPDPHEEEEALDEEEDDPRAELVRRLLEYQKYKLVAEQLGGRAVFGRDVFGRGSAAPEAEGPAPLAQLSMFKLLDALDSVLERFKQTGDHLVDFERISISDRINELSDILAVRRRVAFEALFDKDRTRADVVITFLALLEMTKLRLTRIWQEAPYEPIFIELAVRDDSDAPPADDAHPPPSATPPDEPEGASQSETDAPRYEAPEADADAAGQPTVDAEPRGDDSQSPPGQDVRPDGDDEPRS